MKPLKAITEKVDQHHGEINFAIIDNISSVGFSRLFRIQAFDWLSNRDLEN